MWGKGNCPLHAARRPWCSHPTSSEQQHEDSIRAVLWGSCGSVLSNQKLLCEYDWPFVDIVALVS